MKVFAERLLSDDMFFYDVKLVKTKENLVSFAKKYSIRLSAEDARKLLPAVQLWVRQKGELADEDLALVSGGTTTYVAAQVC